jgi:hypothetical protein
MAEPALDSDEFIILRDPSCQAARMHQGQYSFYPSVLYLTNRRVHISSLVPFVDPQFITLDSIHTSEICLFNDAVGIKLAGSASVTFFLPETEHQELFLKLVSKLSSAAKSGQIDCDSIGLSVQRRFLQSASIGAFYTSAAGNEDHFDGPPVESTEDEFLRSSPESFPVRMLAFVIDVMNVGELFLIAFFFTILGLMSILFWLIPFGVSSCGVIFLLMIRHGFGMIFSKKPGRNLKRPSGEFGGGSIKAFNQFVEAFRKRLLWRNPRRTLETVMFLLSTAIMFAFFDPAFVLFLSLVGLAFVERWNPFGFGHISEIFSNLFSF